MENYENRRANTSLRSACSATVALLVAVATAAAQDRVISNDEWCDGHGRQDGESVCEVREWTLDPVNEVRVDAKPNGGIAVEAWDGPGMRVRAKVHAWAASGSRARELVDAIDVSAGASTGADGPRTRGREGWSVSYRLMVPPRTDLELESTNGGIDISGVNGELRFRTTNGGVHLEGIGGDVEGSTTNGGMHVILTGNTWHGAGLDVKTTNGGVRLGIPDGYSAHLEAGTVNGGFEIGFPVTVQGKIDRRLSADLGGGGPTIRAYTTNGGVRIGTP